MFELVRPFHHECGYFRQHDEAKRAGVDVRCVQLRKMSDKVSQNSSMGAPALTGSNRFAAAITSETIRSTSSDLVR